LKQGESVNAAVAIPEVRLNFRRLMAIDFPIESLQRRSPERLFHYNIHYPPSGNGSDARQSVVFDSSIHRLATVTMATPVPGTPPFATVATFFFDR